MTIWFTSDTHFGHANIVRLANRPFKDTKVRGEMIPAVQIMNEAIVNNWNACVLPGDKVYHMGDVALGKIDDSLEYIHRLNGEITLVTGNHDRNFRLGKRSAGLEPDEWDERYKQFGFAHVVPGNLALSGFEGMEPVMLSHFPYTGDHFDGDRFEEVRAKDSGLPIVHGHTHAHTTITYSARETLQIHVGVDSWNFRPVSYQQVTNIIRSLRVEGVDTASPVV